MKNIYLIGMPGVGKSYWAAQLAVQLGYQFIDLDDIVKVKTGKTISELFGTVGDAAFRKIERETLQQVMQVFGTDTVVACGGGTPCFYDNLQRMKAAGRVIYLEASLEYLIQNLEQERDARPLLRQEDWQQQLEKMAAERKCFYTQAHHTLAAETLSVADFVAVL